MIKKCLIILGCTLILMGCQNTPLAPKKPKVHQRIWINQTLPIEAQGDMV